MKTKKYGLIIGGDAFVVNEDVPDELLSISSFALDLTTYQVLRKSPFGKNVADFTTAAVVTVDFLLNLYEINTITFSRVGDWPSFHQVPKNHVSDKLFISSNPTGRDAITELRVLKARQAPQGFHIHIEEDLSKLRFMEPSPETKRVQKALEEIDYSELERRVMASMREETIYGKPTRMGLCVNVFSPIKTLSEAVQKPLSQIIAAFGG